MEVESKKSAARNFECGSRVGNCVFLILYITTILSIICYNGFTMRELFIEAGCRIEVDDVTQEEVILTDNMDPEKLVRLVISECIGICEDIGSSSDGHYCADAIIKKFNFTGV